MKLVAVLFLLVMSFSSSANNGVITEKKSIVTIESTLVGPGKKNTRKSKRINKKRKRKCSKWGKKSYAG